MTALYLLEPANPGAAWAPFTAVRPLAELRAGAWLIRERWAGMLGGLDVTAILGTHVLDFADTGSPPVQPPTPVEGPAIVAASWFAPAGLALELNPDTRRLVNEGVTVGWVVPEGEQWGGAEDMSGREQEIDGMVLHGAYDLVTALEHLLLPDCGDFLAEASDPIPDAVIIIGDPAEVILLGAVIEPGVIFDTRQGVIVVEHGAQVRAGARLEGPLYIGAGTIIAGGAVRHSAIGPQCRVHGEVSSSVFLGYANKSHDGFLGHSVLGHWVNLGAGTITSNLKNTYGEIGLAVGGERLPTGRTLLGSLIGDHAKTAIGTLLPTGCVVGAGANLFGAGQVPKVVPPMAWGMGDQRVDADRLVAVAARVMPRRDVEMTPEREQSLRAIHARLVR
jgi:UDP-N-acetylglucosamine diphosphorylase / glucose-1-phosphate thymidylyltransferase / UDP-N-acetylgalactosamine diphosphorylase / glucosamine-1-phosphate N-acetyltransferase / galactosamine-1-phosphate N-acetyltransferase